MCSQFGYDAYFLWRLDYEDLALRIRDREMEFVWRTSDVASDAARDIFAGVLYPPGNWPPSTFLWEPGYDDPPMMDDPELDDRNVDERVDSFIGIVRDHVSSAVIRRRTCYAIERLSKGLSHSTLCCSVL